jgi:hypothetical protein
LVISIIALIVAVGGGTYAIAINSNKTKKIAKKTANTQIKKKAPGLSVAHADSADGAPPTGAAGGGLSGNYPNPEIGNSAVGTSALASNAVTFSKLAAGSVHGSQLGNTTQVVSASAPVLANNNGFTSATCPAGSKVLSGGGGASSFGVHMVESFQSGNGWLVAVQNTTAANQTFFATAVCLVA